MPRFFAAVPDDVLFAGGNPSVWAFADNGRIVAYNESFRQVFNAFYVPSNGGSPIFTEGKDGHLYAVINDGAGLRRNVVKLTPKNNSISSEQIATFASGRFALDAVLIDPAGRVFFKESQTTGVYAPFGTGHKRLDGASLVDAGSIDIPFSAYVKLVLTDYFITYNKYQAQDMTQDIYRLFHEAILASGRWITADPLRNMPLTDIPGNWENAFREWTAPGDYNEHLVTLAYSDTSYISIQIRVWGNAWWERLTHTDAWSAVANGGISSATPEVAYARYISNNYFIVEGQAGASPPSGHKTARNSRLGTEYLPTLRFNRHLWWHWIPGDFGGSVDYVTDTDVPVQQPLKMVADDTYVYLLMGGATDGVATFYPHALYRAAIPSIGATPTWTKIADEPATGWSDLAVSEKWLWIVQGNELHAYTKAGVHVAKVKTFSSLASLTTAWKSRWK